LFGRLVFDLVEVLAADLGQARAVAGVGEEHLEYRQGRRLASLEPAHDLRALANLPSDLSSRLLTTDVRGI
jgi:hypothetical protein